MSFRLSAANACLPFLYPRLSATQVNANHTITKVDSNDLLRRLDERLARLAGPPPPLNATPDGPPLTIEIAIPEAED
jgi:hypothetical protein